MAEISSQTEYEAVHGGRLDHLNRLFVVGGVIKTGNFQRENLHAVYATRGLSNYDKGNYDRAIADYNLAILLKPDYAFAYANRGFAYADRGEIDRAEDDFFKAAKLDPFYEDLVV